MTVTGKGETITAPLLWAFGRGQAGQTYVFERGRQPSTKAASASTTRWAAWTSPWARSRASRRTSTRPPAAGWTPSARAIASAAIRPAGYPAAACTWNRWRPAWAANPATDRRHNTWRRCARATRQRRRCRNWRGRSAEEMSELCGRCHRTWSQIALNGPRGVLNVRFQPYRLTNSKCYDTADARIACTACHDPHGPLETSAAAYDAKCTACHSAAQRHQDLPRRQGELRDLPHAEDRTARRARALHGSPDSHRPRRRAVPELMRLHDS